MQSLPHTYVVRGNAEAKGSVLLAAEGLPDLASAAPKQFDGPGDRWSPEALLCAAIASCFILTFRSVARASKLSWHHLDCHVEGALERIDGVTRFTRFTTQATLTVPAGTSVEECQRLLEKSEQTCLIANSLQAARVLEVKVITR